THLFVPHWSKDPAFILTVVGFLGTTISPYLFFWQAGETVEEEVADGQTVEPGSRLTRVKDAEMRMLRTDTVVGMLTSQLICFFIIICTTATLHANHITDINTAQDAAKALLPLGGRASYYIFTLGIVGAGLLAIPTLAGSAAYAIAEAAGWKYGLYRRFSRARGFYLSIAAVIIVSYLMNYIHTFSPIKGLLYSAVLNGIAAPPLIVLLLLICNNKRIVRGRGNGPWSNAFGIAAAVLMSIAVVLMIWGMATGKAG
ncbi:MAG: divalent metal cation transporter, partial [Chloroflexi bacterium]|nr:divalent metal cation transporter [Chloroflexota bacterium]